MANSDCFRDFCLTCDREAPDGPYCSQTCRLLDLEKGDSPYTARQAYMQPPSLQRGKYHPATSYQPASLQPRQLSSAASTPRTSSSYGTAPKAFSNRLMPPAQQSSGYKHAQQERTSQSRQGSQSNGEPLTTSSSNDSFTSNSRSNSRQMDPNAISEGAQLELQEYYRSFDQTRARKRRQSMY